MAAVSATNAGHGRSERGPWDYAVPLKSNEPGNYDVPDYANTTSTQVINAPTMTANGAVGRPLAGKDPNVNSVRADANGQYNAVGKTSRLTHKTSNLGAREDSDESSEYAKSQLRHKVSNQDNKTRKGSAQKPAAATSEEEQFWIHRDKLAQIESKELEEAGFRLPIDSRAASRAAYSNYEPTDDAEYIDEYDGTREYGDEEHMGWELRTPEEVAAEFYGGYGAQVRPPPRAVNSKIPVKRSGTFSSSPPTERESPRPRSRNLSGQYTGIPEPRNRSKSITSGNRPYTPNISASASASGASGSDKEASPNAAKNASKTGYTPRKSSQGSRAASVTKTRVPSTSKADSPPKRPGTSSGLHQARPSTSVNRPEGEAPWIASMYKPDPRLPPDQQVLPTHARRMAQEQWEKEGKVGTVYDKDFRLLNTTTLDYNPISMEDRHKSVDEHNRFLDQQMLRLDAGSNGSPTKLSTLNGKPTLHELSINGHRSSSQGPRPGTSGTDHGGYKTMPTIHGPPTPTISTSQKPLEPLRMQEIDDDVKQKKACCCIVM